MAIHFDKLKNLINARFDSSFLPLISGNEAGNSMPIAAQIEVARVDLLYRQNVIGILALLVYASSYLYASIGVVNTSFLVLWYSSLIVSAILRGFATYLWRKKKHKVSSAFQTQPWLRFMQAMLLVSGVGWGVIGWNFAVSPSYDQQIFTVLSVVFMSAGAIVCYSASLAAMYFVVLPAMLPWSIGLLLSPSRSHKLMGFLGLLYSILGSIAGRVFSNYLRTSLRITIENVNLVEETRKQLRVRGERDKYEAESKAKSIFLANASHEIRTPLAALNGFTEDLIRRDGLAPDVAADLQVIFRNGKYLASLVNDLLDLSKIETGQLYIQKSMISPLKEIEEAILVVKSVYEARSLSLDLKHSTPIPDLIESDSMRFRQVLINLLSNAAKFTELGKIIIEVAFFRKNSESGTLKITVSDSGIGLSPDVAARLFQPFNRGSEQDVQRVPGSGLGLALSRDIARALGGDVQLLRSSPRAGSVFEFSIEALFNAEVTSKRLSPRLTPKPNLLGASILVVDDSFDLQVLMRRFFERRGASVEVCGNGAEGVAIASKREFDAIFMDIKMPVLNGYEATRQLRDRGYTRPIIALTAHANTEDRLLCYQAGCDDYLSKPVDSNHLLETLDRHLSLFRSINFQPTFI
jgi:signal transduction histidine kinase/ActR/RegA family two-component response regulator